MRGEGGGLAGRRAFRGSPGRAPRPSQVATMASTTEGDAGADVCPVGPGAATPAFYISRLGPAPWTVPPDSELADILRKGRVVAVVGISDRTDRPSHRVAQYLQEQGYRIVPVNPRLEQVLGERAYPDLDAVPFAVDVVDVFRRPPEVPVVAEAAIRKGARVLWLQEGVVSEAAAEMARAAGLRVVMDRCMFKEHHRLSQSGLLAGGPPLEPPVEAG